MVSPRISFQPVVASLEQVQPIVNAPVPAPSSSGTQAGASIELADVSFQYANAATRHKLKLDRRSDRDVEEAAKLADLVAFRRTFPYSNRPPLNIQNMETSY